MIVWSEAKKIVKHHVVIVLLTEQSQVKIGYKWTNIPVNNICVLNNNLTWEMIYILYIKNNMNQTQPQNQLSPQLSMLYNFKPKKYNYI